MFKDIFWEIKCSYDLDRFSGNVSKYIYLLQMLWKILQTQIQWQVYLIQGDFSLKWNRSWHFWHSSMDCLISSMDCLILSTSIYDLVLLDVCHFHHQTHTFLSNHWDCSEFSRLSRYSCLYLGSLHPRIFFQIKAIFLLI